MASDELDIATGLTLSMTGTSLSSRKITDYQLPPGRVAIHPASNQDTTGVLDSIAADLIDAGVFRCVLEHQQDYDYYADLKTRNTVTITTPSTATVVFTGIFEAYEPQQSVINEPMHADIEIRVCSQPVITGAS